MSELLIGIRTVAKRSETDASTVLGWIQNGNIPTPAIVGGLPRWPVAVIDDWLKAGCPKCEPPHFRVMHKVRRAWLDDDDNWWTAELEKLSAKMDSITDPAILAKCEAIWNS